MLITKSHQKAHGMMQKGSELAFNKVLHRAEEMHLTAADRAELLRLEKSTQQNICAAAHTRALNGTDKYAKRRTAAFTPKAECLL